MRRVLSTVIAVALLLGLGALAVMALPSGSTPMTASSLAAAPLAAEPDAPAAVAATQNFNMIAMPLNATNQFTSAGLDFSASGLAEFIGTGVVQVSHWDAANQTYELWTIDPEFGGSGVDFALDPGKGVYWVLLDSTATDIVSFVGDVPAKGSVQFTFEVGDSCLFNEFLLPLDSTIASADELATSLGATQVSQWNATDQAFELWTIDPEFGGSGINFTTKIGYPYSACLSTSSVTPWP